MRLEKNCLPPVPVAQVPREPKQSGFIILMGMLMLVVGAAVWFGNVGNMQAEMMEITQENAHSRELQKIKEKMLVYTMFQPEIFGTPSNTTTFQTADKVPGPGYFPCPDSTGDGESNAPCGSGVSVVIGRVPVQISSRRFGFLDQTLGKESYWYAVDTRFLVQNADYNNFGGTEDVKLKRYSPLNTSEPDFSDLTTPPPPLLTLDGVTDIVMVLFYAGEPLSGQNRSSGGLDDYLDKLNNDGDGDFISTHSDTIGFNDNVLAITHAEWSAAVLARVSQDVNPVDNVPDLCSISATDPHWFNACNNVYKTGNDGTQCSWGSGGVDNQVGQGWRELLGCP
jgi:hypothetical protein